MTLTASGGWVGFCPVCGLLTVGRVPVWRGSRCFRVAPRLAGHLWAEHPYEAVVLLQMLARLRQSEGPEPAP